MVLLYGVLSHRTTDCVWPYKTVLRVHTWVFLCLSLSIQYSFWPCPGGCASQWSTQCTVLCVLLEGCVTSIGPPSSPWVFSVFLSLVFLGCLFVITSEESVNVLVLVSQCTCAEVSRCILDGGNCSFGGCISTSQDSDKFSCTVAASVSTRSSGGWDFPSLHIQAQTVQTSRFLLKTGCKKPISIFKTFVPLVPSEITPTFKRLLAFRFFSTVKCQFVSLLFQYFLLS